MEHRLFFYYRKWKNEGIIGEIHEYLRGYIRKKAGRKTGPGIGIIGSKCENFVVHAANTHDGKGAMEAIKLLLYKFSRLVKIIAGGGYRGELINNVKHAFDWILEIVMRSDSNSKFTTLPKRWIVERTFARFENYRRLAIDYEFTMQSAEAMIHLAMIKLMINRIY
jgi:putative transposase